MGGIQLKRSMVLHRGPGPRKSRAIVGKDLENPPMAKNQNVRMASSSQPNSNLGEPHEKGFHRSLSLPSLSSQGGNN
jgi:hypothetical protein